MRARRSHRVMAALALTSVALGACSVLTGLDADYSSSAHDGAAAIGSEGGGDGGPGTDGATGMEGSTNDGMVKPDGDAGLTTWCASMQDGAADNDFFCTDFETASFPVGGGVPAGWTSITNDRDAGTFAFVEVDASSHALDVTSSSTGSQGANTRLLKVLNGIPNDAHKYLHYDLQYEFCVLDANLQYAAVGLLMFAQFSTATKEHGLAAFGPGPPLYVSQQGGTGALMKKLTNDGQWHRAHITLDRMPADATYSRTILVDGNSVDGDVSSHTIDAADPTEISLGVFNAAAAAGTAHVQFDNVVFRRSL